MIKFFLANPLREGEDVYGIQGSTESTVAIMCDNDCQVTIHAKLVIPDFTLEPGLIHPAMATEQKQALSQAMIDHQMTAMQKTAEGLSGVAQDQGWYIFFDKQLCPIHARRRMIANHSKAWATLVKLDANRLISIATPGDMKAATKGMADVEQMKAGR